MPSYALRLDGKLVGLQPDDFFKYSTAIAAISVDAVLLLIVLVIARGLPLRETFALGAPSSWRRAFVIGLTTLVAAYAISFLEVALVTGAGREQGVPEFWDPARVGAWAANLFAIAVFVPIFEESLCRGLGYALFEPLGAPVAVLITAVAFTLAHGVIIDIPVILATGIGLGYMRASTGSIYPCIALHGFFNGFGLVVAALVARG
ncbi:MAG TPA: CPBP family intramembrane glutamic endopeptidase [Candidatus Polarisedimenticolia bacterium]|nr:CPBP family intramembrane glutamic endopeptidase [Candidatus Polarisedimenticolia bacterium]